MFGLLCSYAIAASRRTGGLLARSVALSEPSSTGTLSGATRLFHGRGKTPVKAMFVQQVNAVTGESEWVPVSTPDAPDAGGDALSALVSATSYLDMLQDRRRNAAYQQALENTLQPHHRVLDIGTGTGLLAMMAARHLQQLQQGVAPGSSSGQSSSGGVSPQVTACEVFPPMAIIADRVVSANGLSSIIKVVNKRSDDLWVGAPGPAAATAIPEEAGSSKASARRAAAAAALAQDDADALLPARADVIVTEIFDSELLAEGLLPTLRHAVAHLLKEGGSVIPARARVFCQLVESPLLSRMSTPTGLPPGSQPPPAPGPVSAVQVLDVLQELNAAARTVHYATGQLNPLRELHVDQLYERGLLKPLSEPQEVLSLELARPPAHNSSAVHTLRVSSEGTAHALVFWWQLDLDGRGQLLLSTCPRWLGPDPAHGGDGGPLHGVAQGWRDHWKQCWAQLGTGPKEVRPGDSVPIRVAHDDINITASLSPGDEASGLQPPPQRLPPMGVYHSPRRTWQEGDIINRWAPLGQALAECVYSCAEKGIPCEVVVLGDGPLLPLVSLAAAGHVGMPGVPGSSMTIVQDSVADEMWIKIAAGTLGQQHPGAAALTRVWAFKRSQPYFKRLRHMADSQPARSGPPMIVAAEPYYSLMEGQLPWTHLRFWNQLQLIRDAHPGRPVLSVLGGARLRGVAVSLPELWRTRSRLDQVQGLQLAPANKVLGAVGVPEEEQQEEERRASSSSGSSTGAHVPPVYAYSAWQCGGGYKELSPRFDVMQFDFSKPVSAVEGQVRVELQLPEAAAGSGTAAGSDAVCHAIMFWLDYELMAVDGTLSNAPGEGGEPAHTLQGVLLLPHPIKVGAGQQHGSCLQVQAAFDPQDGDITFTVESGAPNYNGAWMQAKEGSRARV